MCSQHKAATTQVITMSIRSDVQYTRMDIEVVIQ